MIEQLMSDLQQVIFAYAIFACAWGSNTVLALYYNVATLNEAFNIKRFFSGFKKALVVVVGTFLLVTAIDLLLIMIDLSNTDAGTVITVVAVIGTIGIATVNYVAQAYEKLQAILQTNK
ncbi:hypothetical protein LJC02_01940 [Breznakia sp. OttesenSCG-928-G09]|nr:hypothetical protein [Breznakia sp. OttesenSCG-928-G09]